MMQAYLSKIINYAKPLQSALLFFCLLPAPWLQGQDGGFVRPPVTGSLREYRAQVRKTPEKKMIELKELIPGLVYDLRYATTNNFMNRLMYPAGTNRTFLRAGAAEALRKAAAELQGLGYGLKIFDAYRPYAVTVKFWELVKDERYVANPSKGSGHNRGIAVDLTLIRLSDGEEVDMGTGFDNFSDSAHHSFKAIPAVQASRQLLKITMEKYGFRYLETEWWHYSFTDPIKYEVLDLPFRKLARAL